MPQTDRVDLSTRLDRSDRRGMHLVRVQERMLARYLRARRILEARLVRAAYLVRQ